MIWRLLHLDDPWSIGVGSLVGVGASQSSISSALLELLHLGHIDHVVLSEVEIRALLAVLLHLDAIHCVVSRVLHVQIGATRATNRPGCRRDRRREVGMVLIDEHLLLELVCLEDWVEAILVLIHALAY